MRSILVTAREGRAARVPAGTSFRVVDLHGGQVVDLFAFRDGDPAEHASAEHTRVQLLRLFPQVGESFVTNRRRPILTLEEDRSPRLHDMLCAACDAERYASLGAVGSHASCRENLEIAMAELGYPDPPIPQPINLFMNVGILPDGRLDYRTAASQPGDFVRLRAEMDAVVVASSCPQDLVQISRGGPKDVLLEVLD